MPCSDGAPAGPDYGDIRRLEDKIRFLEAALCGLLHVVPVAMIEKISAEDAGITTDQIMAWAAKHAEADRERRRRESLPPAPNPYAAAFSRKGEP